MINRSLNKLLNLRNRHFFFIDFVCFSLAPTLALTLRLDGFGSLNSYASSLLIATPLFLTIKLTLFYRYGLYRHYWLLAGIDELEKIVKLVVIAFVIQTALFNTLYYTFGTPFNTLPRSLPWLDSILSLLLVSSTRISLRVAQIRRQKRWRLSKQERLLIIGAGSAGVALVKQIQSNRYSDLHPVAFIDDDSNKLNLYIQRLLVVGNRHNIPTMVASWAIDRIIIAIPSVSGTAIREIVGICQATGVPTSTLPGLHDLIDGVSLDSLREVKVEDLLRRKPIKTEVEQVFRFLQGKIVLVTGAGGSIGSEICRQVCRCQPQHIILLGHGENSVFNIQQELEATVQRLRNEGDPEHIPRLTAFIADLRFPSRLESVFLQFRPDIVFHAAAHKHVPLMELNPSEAITNNVQGTQNLVELSLRYQVKHLVMISTDKAVNPTNVMGATKRVAEMLVLQAAKVNKKLFVVVRFGNVLGSRGSVVPTFKNQIASGGPITVTHPDICRYFMTIPEAVQLTLQAAVIGKGGEVFMLNMGEPVKIVDLAKDLIRLSGYQIGKQISKLAIKEGKS